MQVIVLFAGINDIIHGWATSTVLRRFQRFYQHLQQKNPTAKIAIAGILPKRRNRWYAWSKEEEEQLKQENAPAKIVNWRLSELSTAIRGLNFISWSEFSESSDHLLARDGLQTSHVGTYIVAKKFRRVCRELTTVPIVSVPTKNRPLVPTSDSESISPMHVPTSDSVMTNAKTKCSSTSILTHPGVGKVPFKLVYMFLRRFNMDPSRSEFAHLNVGRSILIIFNNMLFFCYSRFVYKQFLNYSHSILRSRYLSLCSIISEVEEH